MITPNSKGVKNKNITFYDFFPPSTVFLLMFESVNVVEIIDFIGFFIHAHLFIYSVILQVLWMYSKFKTF